VSPLMIANVAPAGQLTSIEVRAPVIAPPELEPLIVMVPLPGVLLPQDTDPEMAVTVPIVPFFWPAGLTSVSCALNCAPDVASKPVTPGPEKLRCV
jgi:hypothetical protein